METGRARLEVTADVAGFAFSVTNLLHAQRVFESSAILFGTEAVTGARGLSSGTDEAGRPFVQADLTLASGSSATARFTADEPDRIRVDLAGPSSPVTQESADLPGDRYYGTWMKYYKNQAGDSVRLDNRGVTHDLVGRMGEAQQTEGSRAPFYFTNRALGVYIHTQAYGTEVAFGVGGKNRFAFEGTSLVYHILVAADMKGALAAHCAVAGPAFLPPDWGLGTMWWRNDAHDTENSGVGLAYDLLRRDADQLIAHQIPATGMLIDRPYGTGSAGWGNYDFDAEVQPAGTNIVGDLDARGLRTVLWIANRLSASQYEEADQSGGLYAFFRDHGSMPAADLRDAATYAWFRDKLAILTGMGVDGFKIDRGGEGEMPDAVNNENVRLFGQAASESFGTRSADAVIYARDAFDGSRRHVGIWNGDTPATTWGSITTIRHAVRSGLINFPFFGTDGGGYVGETPPKEYWCRAMAVAAYLPMMNVRLGPYRTPWDHGRIPGWDAEVLAITVKHAREHHALLPYVRSALAANLATGLPVVRAMFLEFPGEASLADRDDQYLYGDHLLVAPVLDENQVTEEVYFPGPGTRWVDYNDRSTIHPGGTTATVPAPLDVMPVFAREGAIIPRGDLVAGNQGAWIPDWQPGLTVEVFPSDTRTGRLDHWNGSALVELRTWVEEGRVRFTGGDLALPAEIALQLGRFHSFSGSILEVRVNGVAAPAGAGWVYDPGPRILHVDLPVGAGDIEVRLSGAYSLSITEPGEGLVADGPVAFSGVAAGPEGVASVKWRVDGGAWHTASGTTAWSFTLPHQPPGSHAVEVRAEGPDGTDGASQTRNVVFRSAAAGPLVSAVVLATGRTAVVDPSFQTGDEVHTDRKFTWADPGSCTGATLIRLPNDDKSTTAGVYLGFDLGAPALVSVLYDTRGIPPAGTPPSWMSGFVDTGETLSILGDSVGNAKFRVFSARFNAGRIQVGGNKASPASGAGSNYTVAVRALEGFEAFQVASFSASVLADTAREATHYGPLANPDDDLLLNIEEYGFGGDANAPDGFPPLAVFPDAGFVRVRFRRAISCTGILHEVDVSADLARWTTHGLEELGARVVEPDLLGDGRIEEVEVEVPHPSGNLFVRLRTRATG